MYERQIALVRRLLKKKGEQSILRRYTPGTEVSAGRPGANTASVDMPVSAVYLPPDLATLKSFSYIVGTEVLTGHDLVFAEPPLGWEIKVTDELYRADDTAFARPLKITSIDKLNPNGETILYTLLVTK